MLDRRTAFQCPKTTLGCYVANKTTILYQILKCFMFWVVFISGEWEFQILAHRRFSYLDHTRYYHAKEPAKNNKDIAVLTLMSYLSLCNV